MTGFLTIVRGVNLTNESVTARVRIFVAASDCFLTWATGSMGTSESLPCGHQQVFENRPETQSREERESTHDQNRRHEQTSKQSACDWERTGRLGSGFLFRQTSGNSQHRNDHEEPTK